MRVLFVTIAAMLALGLPALAQSTPWQEARNNVRFAWDGRNEAALSAACAAWVNLKETTPREKATCPARAAWFAAKAGDATKTEQLYKQSAALDPDVAAYYRALAGVEAAKSPADYRAALDQFGQMKRVTGAGTAKDEEKIDATIASLASTTDTWALAAYWGSKAPRFRNAAVKAFMKMTSDAWLRSKPADDHAVMRAWVTTHYAIVQGLPPAEQKAACDLLGGGIKGADNAVYNTIPAKVYAPVLSCFERW